MLKYVVMNGFKPKNIEIASHGIFWYQQVQITPRVGFKLKVPLIFSIYKNPYMGIKTIMVGTHSDAISIPAIILKKWDIGLL